MADRLLDLLVERYASAGRTGGYVQLANVGSVDGVLEVAPGVRIRSASETEVEELRRGLAEYAHWPSLVRNPYETKLRREPWPGGPPNSHREVWEPLASDQHRYVVAEHPSGNAQVHLIAEASTLTPNHLELGFSVSLGSPTPIGCGMNFAGRALQEAQHDDGYFSHFTIADGAELAEVVSKRAQHDDAVVPLGAAIQSYQQLRAIPRDSGMRFLGYFAILESLLTHQPKPTDPTESLTRQVRQKAMLLSRRFRHPLSYADFETTKVDKVWTALYGVRSKLAHGAVPDFADRDCRALRDFKTATRFVAGATWRVMRQALEEPHLVADLKEV